MWHDSLDVTWLVYDMPQSCVTCPSNKGMLWSQSSLILNACHHSYLTWYTHMWHDSRTYDANLVLGVLYSESTLILSHKWLFVSRHSNRYRNLLMVPRQGGLMSTCDGPQSRMAWLIHVWQDSLVCDTSPTYVTRLFHVWPDTHICDTTPSAQLKGWWCQYVTCLHHVWCD